MLDYIKVNGLPWYDAIIVKNLVMRLFFVRKTLRVKIVQKITKDHV